MTYQEAAQTALDVQDAVNLSGIVRTFSEAMVAVWEEARRLGKGTEYVNRHPIATLFLSKLIDLNHSLENREYGDALFIVQAIADGRESK